MSLGDVAPEHMVSEVDNATPVAGQPANGVEMIPVTSSNLAAIGHDATNQLLYVEFNSGDTWRYHRVPTGVFDLFKAAPSVGKFFHAQIKPNYQAEKVS